MRCRLASRRLPSPRPCPPQAHLCQGVLECLLGIQLRADAPPEVASSPASECALGAAGWPAGSLTGHLRLLRSGPGDMHAWCQPHASCRPTQTHFVLFIIIFCAVVEVCHTYDAFYGQDQCSLLAANACREQLATDAAVPAAVMLHSLMTQLWRKPVRRRLLFCHFCRIHFLLLLA